MGYITYLTAQARLHQAKSTYVVFEWVNIGLAGLGSKREILCYHTVVYTLFTVASLQVHLK